MGSGLIATGYRVLSSSTVIVACFVLVLVAGMIEAAVTARARASVPIRVHVNGSRGKSSTTRLISAVLREAGIPVLAKVTGATPVLILPDGTERRVKRLAPASIREQIRLLWMARRLGVRAIVVECMAIQPDLQWVSERRIVASTVGVITNVRPDHLEEMGGSSREIALSLANTVPRRATLVTGEDRFEDVFASRAARLGTRVVVAKKTSRSALTPAWQAENEAVALAVARELGVRDGVALAAIGNARARPGALANGTLQLGGTAIACLDATPANDPESFDSVVDDWLERLNTTANRLVVVFNHRDDRPGRIAAFARQSRRFAGADSVFVTGDRPALLLERSVARMRPFDYVAPVGLGLISGRVAVNDALVFAGNTRGFDFDTAIRQLGGDFVPRQRDIHG